MSNSLRITLAQQNYHIGNFDGNLAKMRAAIQQALSENADIICFPELAVCGYPPRDFLEFNDFIERCESSIQQLCNESHDIAIVVGSPTRNPRKAGKDLFNSVYFLAKGKMQHVQHKALLPTYDIFDEYRYFEPATEFHTFHYKGVRIAFSICEDIWNVGNENPLYTICPLDEMMDEKPDCIINISASPFAYDHAKERILVAQANVARYGVPMFYVNTVGAQTDIVFDGGSLVLSPDCNVYDELPYFTEHIRTYALDQVLKGGVHNEQPKEEIPLIHDGILLGIRDYFVKLGFKKAILGLSGGIDSALTAVLAVRALGKENVVGILMPSTYSSQGSVDDARALAIDLGIEHHLIPIGDVYDAFLKILQPYFQDKPFNVTEENMQARIRGMYLMSLSNKHGYILLNTTNKSEMSVGYGTLYGDLCGGLAVLADVYKTKVYALVAYINKDNQVIPQNSITKPPSAELRPGQKDSDSLPPYDILDPLLFQYIEMRKGPRELEAMGFDPTLVARVLRMVNMNEFKREQAPPVIRITNKGFGMGRRLPIVAKYLG